MEPMLEGVKVVDLSMWGFVPSCGAVLADWGADVIKVEHPNGDPVRSIGQMGIGLTDTGDFNVMLEQFNRNKRAIALDIARPEGYAVFLKLVAQADVFVTSFLDSARKKLKVMYEDLAPVNPRLVYARGSGQGPRGPDADYAGYDSVSYWARGGISYMLTPPGGPFIQQWGGAGDQPGGMFLAGGIAAALYRRSVTGKGGQVDVSLLNVAIWSSGVDIVPAYYVGKDRQYQTRGTRTNPMIGPYRMGDGRYVQLNMMESDRYWPNFCRAMGREELIEDPRYKDAKARAQNCTALYDLITSAIAARPQAEWVKRLYENGCVFGAVQTPLEASKDPQTVANGYMPQHPANSKARLASSPVQYNKGQVEVRTPAPRLGQHTDEVLRGLGVSQQEIARLRKDGVVR